MPGWSAWTESVPVMRAIKLRNTVVPDPGDDDGSTPCAEYVFITCPHCEGQIESTKKSVKKNKSLLCRTHLAKCPRRPIDTPASCGAIAVATEEIDLPPSKHQKLAVVQHRDCISRQRASDDRISALEQKFQVIEDVIVSCIPGTKRPLDGDSLRLAIGEWTPLGHAPHPRIEEIEGRRAIVPHEQPQWSTENLAAAMLPQLKTAVVDGLACATSTDRELHLALRRVNKYETDMKGMQERHDALQSNFDRVLVEKGRLEQKLARVAKNDIAYIAQLQGVSVL